MIDWRALERAIEGDVMRPGEPGYDEARRPAMARFEHVRPAAVVRCHSAADVAETLALAQAAGVEIAVRGGGHSVAGRSSTEGIVIDLAPMSSVRVDGGVATAGGGARLGGVYDALDAHGLTIPAGCGPTVGIGGLTLGGGLGILGRRHGLTCDHLLRADVVLADGRLVTCDEREQEDLFWALRGAGGGFGVVTSFVFRTLPAPEVTTFRLSWPAAAAATLAGAWQEWAPTGPDALDATLRLTEGEVEVFGAWLGDEAGAAAILAELPAPASTELYPAPYREAKRRLDQEAPPGHLFTKSEFFRRPLPAAAIAALVENLPGGGDVTFTPWGGAYNRVAPDATAFAHRDERFLVQHLMVGPAAPAWLERSWAIVHPHGSGGVYPNFPDPEVDDRAYLGSNLERVRRVKAAYDPANVFL
jgi:FAD/FMN-containing dehydrogenase